jgi:uncharacterized protein YbcI
LLQLLAGLHRFLSLLVVTTHEEAGPEPPIMETQPLAGKSPNANISTGAVKLLHDYTGRGPTRARTIINHDAVMIILADILTRGEHRLVETGKAERVLELRHDYQTVMRDDLIRLVEGELDRKVIAFMSDNHIDPDMAVEVFVLEPGGDDHDGMTE